MRPGSHSLIATNAFVAPLLNVALVASYLEFRVVVIRLVRTLRGGVRPKLAEAGFSDVSTLARGCDEPWEVFRSPLSPKMTVCKCLRRFQTDELRRYRDGRPFKDVILSERTPKVERQIACRPRVKPQSLLRRLVYAALPLGEGVVVDPFLESRSTVAVAEAAGVCCVDVERYGACYEASRSAIGQLATLRLGQVDSLVSATAPPPHRPSRKQPSRAAQCMRKN